MRYVPQDKWNPGLTPNTRTLAEVLMTLPGEEQGDIPWQVRFLENPKSPFALPGAVSLHVHDCLHVILGRGLTNQDEAFVIGFSMAADPSCTFTHFATFSVLAKSWFYPIPFRMTETDLIALDLGFTMGKTNCRPGAIYDTNFYSQDVLNMPVDQLRSHMGISEGRLKVSNTLERAIIPGTPTSLRLDTPDQVSKPEVNTGWDLDIADLEKELIRIMGRGSFTEIHYNGSSLEVYVFRNNLPSNLPSEFKGYSINYTLAEETVI